MTADIVQPWSLKHVHRLIVTSAAYRQDSKVAPALYARDPYNRLVARGPRLRVEGEIVRDIALSASGLLNAKIGGPSIFAPAPEFLFVKRPLDRPEVLGSIMNDGPCSACVGRLIRGGTFRHPL